MTSMNSSKVISFVKAFESNRSREAGEKARKVLERLLEENEYLVLDLENQPFSPSFVDSTIAVLAAQMGLEDFKRRVRIINVEPSTRALIKHTISVRCDKRCNIRPARRHAVQ